MKHPFAAIDIGTNAVRMNVAEMSENAVIRHLATLQQSVSLGRDTFSKGYIDNSTINECIRSLNNFRGVLNDYGITSPESIRCVATSAVREASNSDIFIDRVSNKSGFNICLLEEAHVNRYLFLAVEPLFRDNTLKKHPLSVVVEVGAGSTEILILKNGGIAFSSSYKFGSLRLLEMLGDNRSSFAHIEESVKSHVARIIDQIKLNIGSNAKPLLIGLGSDLRLAIAAFHSKLSESNKSAILKISQLRQIVRDTEKLSTDDIVDKYHIPYSDGDTLLPALLLYLNLAESVGTKSILTVTNSIRDGIIMEMSSNLPWRSELQKEILHSAFEICEKYKAEKDHAKKVAELSIQLFQELYSVHLLPPRFELLLHVAALLHDIGLFVSNSNHHKHSAYLIENANLFGLTNEERSITAQIARYHRKALPSENHEQYMGFPFETRMNISKAASLLRIADALDRKRLSMLKIQKVTLKDDCVQIKLKSYLNIKLEDSFVKKKSDLFDKLFGLRIELKH